MKNVFILLILVILSSCELNELSSITISKQDLIGNWKQASPTILTTKNLSTGSISEWICDETYQINNDNSFEISGILFLKIGKSGSFDFDPISNEVKFECVGKYVDINGIPIQLEKTNQIFKWKIQSLYNDSLNVLIYHFDSNTQETNSEGYNMIYVKQ